MNGLRFSAIHVTLLAAAALALSACSSSTRVTQTQPQPTTDSAAMSESHPAHQARTGGPPPHAKAHGYRTKHRFNYYPSARAYHDCETGSWFWFESGAWQTGAKLPKNVVIRSNEAISVALDARTPYDDPRSPAARTHITQGGNSKHSINDF